jgi:hypothetical protein
MTGRTYERSQQIRDQIQRALNAGNETPSQVENWITTHLGKGEEIPTIATISRIMREEMGYTKEGWKKGK